MNKLTATGLGLRAERFAQEWLEAKGLVLIEHNARTRFFELDLVMLDGEVVVFVEVKYRRSQAFGGGVGAMTADKQRRLSVGALCWLTEQGLMHRPVRFDFIEVIGVGSQARIIHTPDCMAI